jgi:septal ring factor EnvC (AmiA/AmiB activator)
MEWSEWADREIARVCGVSNMTVSRIKKSLQIAKPSEKKYIKDGVEKVMKTDNIGKEVVSLKPAEVFIEDDKLAEMAVAHQELADENAKLMDKIQAVELSEDQQAIDDKFTEYRNQIKALEAELRAVKNSRDQFQQKNAELIKQVSYWRKKAEKAEKVS